MEKFGAEIVYTRALKDIWNVKKWGVRKCKKGTILGMSF